MNLWSHTWGDIPFADNVFDEKKGKPKVPIDKYPPFPFLCANVETEYWERTKATHTQTTKE